MPHEGKSAESAQLEALAKKIDEQNAKIDALSQEILKLEQQLSHARPGVMILRGAWLAFRTFARTFFHA